MIKNWLKSKSVRRDPFFICECCSSYAVDLAVCSESNLATIFRKYNLWYSMQFWFRIMHDVVV